MAFSLSDITDDVGDWISREAENLGETALDVASGVVLPVATVFGPVGIAIGAISIALPGLARGEELDTAIGSGVKYQMARAWGFLKGYVTTQDPEEAARQDRANVEKMRREFVEPVDRGLNDQELKAAYERARTEAQNSGQDLDEVLQRNGLTPEQLAPRLDPNAQRHDAASVVANIHTHTALYNPDWFDPGSGRLISDLDTLVQLRAKARHRLAPPSVLAVLDRRIDAEQRRLGIPPPDVQAILNRPFSEVTSEELARVLQAAKDLGQPEPIIDFIRGNYEMKLEEERAAQQVVVIAAQDTERRNRPSFLQELLTATILTSPAWVPLVLLPLLKVPPRARGRRA